MHVLDLLFGVAARGPRFFADGWGDRALVEAADPAALARRPVSPIRLRLGPCRRTLGGRLREGDFTSPEERLPRCARRARVRLLLPDGPVQGVAVHLSASGDQGFAIRLRFAAPLLARGIGALVLENPYYGERKPARQIGPAVRSVSDLYLMGMGAFEEARSLLTWLREAGYPRVGVTGYSMGGQLSAMAGVSVPFAAAVVPVAPTCSPDSALRGGVLRRLAHWAALAGPGAAHQTAQEALCATLARFSVLALPPPRAPAAAIVVGTRADGVVPPADMRRIADHWRCELRWLEAGHVSAVLRHRDAMREALADAFRRLGAFDAGSPRSPRA
jgi:hypothetical protein